MQLTKFRLKRLKNRETGRVMIMPKAIMCVPMCVCVQTCIHNLLHSPRLSHFFFSSREGHVPTDILKLVYKIYKEKKNSRLLHVYLYNTIQTLFCLTNHIVVQITHETYSLVSSDWSWFLFLFHFPFPIKLYFAFYNSFLWCKKEIYFFDFLSVQVLCQFI